MKKTITELNIDKFINKLKRFDNRRLSLNSHKELTDYVLETISGGKDTRDGESFTRWLKA